MIRIAPSEKDHDNAALENRLWPAAEPAVPAPHVTQTESHSDRPEGLLGLIFLGLTEVRFITERAKLKAGYRVLGQSYHH